MSGVPVMSIWTQQDQDTLDHVLARLGDDEWWTPAVAARGVISTKDGRRIGRCLAQVDADLIIDMVEIVRPMAAALAALGADLATFVQPLDGGAEIEQFLADAEQGVSVLTADRCARLGRAFSAKAARMGHIDPRSIPVHLTIDDMRPELMRLVAKKIEEIAAGAATAILQVVAPTPPVFAQILDLEPISMGGALWRCPMCTATASDDRLLFGQQLPMVELPHDEGCLWVLASAAVDP